jgi:hypoxanthine phosphoribosyltransferase
MEKIYVSANSYLLDSFRLARKILDSGWVPTI